MNLKGFQGRFWLGLSREANSKDFQWSDLSMKTYTNWAAKQPDAPYDQKTCVVASNSDANAGGWSDVNCSEKNGFICRLRRGKITRINLINTDFSYGFITYHLSHSIYKHDAVDIANPSSMQDACFMNFVIDFAQRRVSVAQ